MSLLRIQLTITVILWGICLILFIRAVYRGKLLTLFGKFIWLQVLLSTLVFSLHGPGIEKWLDSYLGNILITLYVKSALLLILHFLYGAMLQYCLPDMSFRRSMRILGILAVVYGLFAAILLPFTSIVGRESLRMLIYVPRDAIAITFIVLVLVPGAYQLYHREKTPTVRAKYFATIGEMFCFIGMSTGGLLKSVLTGLHVSGISHFEEPFDLFVFVGFLFFLVLILPNTWLVWLQFPSRFMMCWRLRKIEEWLIRSMEVSSNTRFQLKWYQWLSLGGLELETYRSLIAILDCHHLVSEDSHATEFYSRLEEVIRQKLQYREFVQALAKLAVTLT